MWLKARMPTLRPRSPANWSLSVSMLPVALGMFPSQRSRRKGRGNHGDKLAVKWVGKSHAANPRHGVWLLKLQRGLGVYGFRVSFSTSGPRQRNLQSAWRERGTRKVLATLFWRFVFDRCFALNVFSVCRCIT